VAFDTGGLNLKTGSNMTLMKKDMGGAAHALALARMVMIRTAHHLMMKMGSLSPRWLQARLST
jgi:leucyl aminopeptidase